MNIAIISGSVRSGRHSHKVATYLHQQLSLRDGIKVDLMDLHTWQLPILENRWKKLDNPPSNLVNFSASLQTADGLIFVSPEYHGSYTGVLKNAVDHYWHEFHRKPIGVVATGSGKFGGINASTEMQQLILSLGAFPMP
ncbi:MAG: NAD(P)H-dependent oxidoreductase, partial [Bacteroidota bacterium]